MRPSQDKIVDSQIVACIVAIAEKECLEPENLFAAIESQIAAEIGKNQYGHFKIAAKIDRKTGEIKLFRRFLVVEDDELDKMRLQQEQSHNDQIDITSPDYNPSIKAKWEDVISASEANRIYSNQNPKVGSIVTEPLPNLQSGYAIAKILKLKIESVVNFLVRKRQYDAYKTRIGKLITGIVKKSMDARKGCGFILDISGVDAILPHSGLIREETFRPGERVKCVVRDVQFSLNKPQVFLSRTSKDFLKCLFFQQIPELYDQVVFLKSIARDPGSRAKVAVYSTDRNIDAVGACIGIRGNRINAISDALGGEKIDVIEYSSDIQNFVANAIKPIKYSKISVDEAKNTIELVTPEENLSLIIGARGQNIKLLSELLEHRVNVFSEAEISKKKMEEFTKGAELFVNALNVEEVIAQLLVTEGFSSVESIAQSNAAELAYIEGFDIDIAQEIHQRAVKFIDLEQKQLSELFKKYSVEDDFLQKIPLNSKAMEALFASGIRKTEDVAYLSSDDMLEIVGANVLDEKTAQAVIMDCRQKLGWVEGE